MTCRVSAVCILSIWACFLSLCHHVFWQQLLFYPIFALSSNGRLCTGLAEVFVEYMATLVIFLWMPLPFILVRNLAITVSRFIASPCSSQSFCLHCNLISLLFSLFFSTLTQKIDYWFMSLGSWVSFLSVFKILDGASQSAIAGCSWCRWWHFPPSNTTSSSWFYLLFF